MKKKILHVAYGDLGNGGIQNVIMSIVRNLEKEFDFDIIVFSKYESYYDKEFEKIGNIYRIPCDKSGNRLVDLIENLTRGIRTFVRTYKILKNNNYDVIHCHNGKEAGLTLLVAKLAKVPIRIAHSNNTESPMKRSYHIRLYRGILKSLIKYGATVKVGSSQAANRYLFGNDEHSIVIYNAIDINKFNPNKYELEPNDNISFLNVGRFTYQKNQLFLLDVFNEFHKMVPKSDLKLVGSGKDELKIKNKIEELCLNDFVTMLPHDSNIPELLSRANYFLFPSNYEGLGIVLIEAQLMGVKCFASTVVPKEADMGLCIFLPLDIGAKGWAQKILEYIHEDNIYAINEVKQKYKEEYNINNIKNKYKQIYQGEYKYQMIQ